MSLQYKDSVKIIVNICEHKINFVYKSAFLSSYFFPKSCLKVEGAAYTRVFTVCVIRWDLVDIVLTC